MKTLGSAVARFMSDKLQFVDAPIKSGFAGNDKLKFIGHKASSIKESFVDTGNASSFDRRRSFG